MMHQASIEADAPQAEHIVRALEEAIEPEAVAVGLFDRGHGRFEIFAHYAESPPRDALLLLIARASGDGAHRGAPHRGAAGSRLGDAVARAARAGRGGPLSRAWQP